MAITSWLRELKSLWAVQKVRRLRRGAGSKPSRRLVLEVLEDRTTPSSIFRVNAASLATSPDGSTWANAFPSLQSVLAIAQPGDQVWVEQGTYTPTTGTGSHGFLQFGIRRRPLRRLCGGRNGTKPTQPRCLYQTILSGDIGTIGDISDNSYHVVFSSGVDGTGVLDGFTITAGNADSSAARLLPRAAASTPPSGRCSAASTTCRRPITAKSRPFARRAGVGRASRGRARAHRRAARRLDHRGGDRRACGVLRRRADPAQGLSEAPARDLQQIRHPADLGLERQFRNHGDTVIALLARSARRAHSPRRLKRFSGKASSMHLVSCRHSTSGRTALRNLATRSMRNRTELIFQVVQGEAHGDRLAGKRATEDARLCPAIKNDFQPGGVP